MVFTPQLFFALDLGAYSVCRVVVSSCSGFLGLEVSGCGGAAAPGVRVPVHRGVPLMKVLVLGTGRVHGLVQSSVPKSKAATSKERGLT